MSFPTSLKTVGNTPLIELPSAKPPGGACILAKWEAANPTGSMKDRMALAMIEAAEADGRLSPGQRVVEYTGGSTGSSLAFVCAAKGYPLTLLTADCFSEEKIETMRALGADVEVFDTPEGKVHPGLVEGWKARVEELVDQTGAFWTAQVHNPDQLDGYDAMAAEILDALEACWQERGEAGPGADVPAQARIDFVMSVGTGGCAMGTSRGLRRRGQHVRVHLVEPAESAYLTKGQGGMHGVEGIAVLQRPPLLDEDLYEDAMAVPEEDGRAMARRIASREGLLVGVSSGLNVTAARRVAEHLDPEAIVLTVLVDTGLKYLDDGLFAEA